MTGEKYSGVDINSAAQTFKLITARLKDTLYEGKVSVHVYSSLACCVHSQLDVFRCMIDMYGNEIKQVAVEWGRSCQTLSDCTIQL